MDHSLELAVQIFSLSEAIFRAKILNMKHLVLIIIAVLVWRTTFSQTQDYQNKYPDSQYQDEINARQAEQDAQDNDPVRKHLYNAADAANNAFDLAKQSAQGAQDALDELTNLHEDDTKDVLQYYADKARQKMDAVESNLKQAIDDAQTAQYEADQAGCGDASDNAQSAAGHFNSAKETLHSAYLRFIDATGDQDADILIKYLTTAYNDLIDAAKELGKGADNLNAVFDAIKSCE